VVDGMFGPGRIETDRVEGTRVPEPPADEAFWAATGTSRLTWDVEAGSWTVVLMQTDGRPGIDAEVVGAVRVGWLLPVAVGLVLVGAGFVGGGTWAIVAAVSSRPGRRPLGAPATAGGTYPVRLEGRLDEPLSRWLWLVKWFLALPHAVVLAGLWIAYTVTTIVAFFAILFTGRYPRSLFDFGVGVQRWTWRVGFYAFSAIGTDRYPPFSLASDPDYPADLWIERPERLSRGLVLVKWWLLALPHLLVVVLLTGGLGLHAGGVITALVLVSGVVLLVSRQYPASLFDVIMGCNRWAYRVMAYVLLMTDEYPPFRFDAGGSEPGVPAQPPLPFDGPPAAERELVDAGR
jgi:hypothetical protein